jgi:multidrug efflux pump subunit AcrB
MTKEKPHISSFSVIVIFVCLGIVGIALMPLLSIQLYPSVATPGLSVSYSWPDVSARIMEQEVTAKLEGLFAAVKGIKSISSVSSKGNGRIDLSFKEDVNRDAMRFEIASLIRQCYPELPVDVSYPQLSLNTTGESTTPVMSYAINASASSHYIRRYAEKEIIPLLSRIKGVNEVQLYGATPYEVQVEFQMEDLQVLGITGDDIATAINTHFKKDLIGKGSYRQAGQDHITELAIQLSYDFADTLIWDKIPVKNAGGRVLYLKDVAKVRYKEQTPVSYYRINGLNTINIAIYSERGVNNIALSKSIQEEVERIRQNLQPGYSILLASDSTEYLTQEINKIIFRTVVSLFILMAFVLLVSRQFRYLLLIVTTLAANLIIACIFFYFFKVELQLYSLAGLTVSLGIIIDNSIIMIDHIRNTGNKKVLLAIFAATLTTIAALGVIFYFQEEQRLHLMDFAWVIIINLSISFAVALFFIPALMSKVKLVRRKSKRYYRRRRRIIKFTGAYEKSILFGKKLKWVYVVVFILGFGIPVHWLPDDLKGDGRWSKIYNATLGSSSFREDIRPTIERILGGSLRLFTVNIFERSYYPEPGKTMLHVNGTMPEGCTVQQLNEAIEEMENFISQFEEIELFQTTVSSYRNSHIAIHFKPEHEWSNFPFILKSQLESKAINLGGADWRVYGVGLGFSNALYEGSKDNRIALEGYNYEQLYQYAELLKRGLVENPRVREVDISGSDRRGARVIHEFFISFNNERLALNDVSPVDFYGSLKGKVYRREINPVYAGDELRRVFLTSDTYGSFNVWDFNNSPLDAGKKLLKLGRFGAVEKRKTGNDIHKYDQQYRLIVAYDFIGPDALGEMVEKQHIEEFTNILPLGYSIRSNQFRGWNRENKTQYYLIFLVIAAIYFICAILLESLLQPLAIIAMIPISFIGVFLTFYFFNLNFDQGGFASFILLSGLAVNAGIYLVNDYNNFQVESGRSTLKLYLKAFNHKIIPVILTILSTVLGLVPFIAAGQKEIFWFAFAAGTIGGLIFSLIGILVYLPLFLRIPDKYRNIQSHITVIQKHLKKPLKN